MLDVRIELEGNLSLSLSLSLSLIIIFFSSRKKNEIIEKGKWTGEMILTFVCNFMAMARLVNL